MIFVIYSNKIGLLTLEEYQMLSEKQFGSFKRGNVSVDAGKTKARISKDYKAASMANKKVIRELAGAPNFHTVIAKDGIISAKQTAAIAQVLGVSPYYYTGESDDKKPFTGEIMTGFYEKHKNEKPTTKSKPAKKKPAAKKAAPKSSKPADKPARPAKPVAPKKPKTGKPVAPPLAGKTNEAFLDIQLDDSAKMLKTVSTLDVESAVLLLKALSCKAKAGGNAEVVYDLIKRLLLS